ncbi:MAG: stage II sporulation protein M, partial [Myxococcales bacterium]|nr:stage II sporulation protein M [Myxococcales bacterium]
ATVASFFAATFPALLRRIRGAFALSCGLLVLGAVSGYALTSAEPDRFYTFVSADMASGRTPSASKEKLEEALYGDGSDATATLTNFAAFLFTHNAKIGLMCFALGFLAGVPVMLLLFINGATLGAMWAVYAAHDLGLEFFTWVAPHGVTELLAVAVCGAAGLSLGYGLVFPGRHRRLENLAARGREAGALAIGAVFMFFVAALIEGFFRQLVQSLEVRALVASATAILWTAYFALAGRGRSVGRDVALVAEPDLEGAPS